MAAVPNYYFNFSFCCPNQGTTFTTLAFEDSGFSAGNTYYIELPQFSGCVTAISESTLIEGSVLYNESDYLLTYYSSCSSCTGSTSGCYPPTPTPTPTIYYSSDTRCGNNILKRNECDPIVIFPLGVICTGTNPTLTTISDGLLSLIISGGTPPYSVSWSTGGNGLYLTNLSVGSYSAVVTDFYGDFTAYTTCTLTAPTPVPTETRVTPTPTPLPDGGTFCLTITTGDYFPTTVQYYFYPQSSQINGEPAYTDGNGHEVVWTFGTPSYWNLTNPPQGTTVTNTEIGFPPVNGWQVSGPSGNVSGISGECRSYANLCLSYRQTKDATSPVKTDQVTLYYAGMVNGQPSWQSEGDGYTITWSSNNNRWNVTSVQTLYYSIVNTNPASPPIAGWVQPGAQPSDYVIVSIGNCIPSSVNNGSTSSSTSVSPATTTGGLTGAVTSNNPSVGDVPFTTAVAGRDTTTTPSGGYECECVAVRTISSYPGTAFYTDCDGNPAQIPVPGGSGVTSRACICRRVGTTISGGVIEEPCQSGESVSGQGTITNICLDILGGSCTTNVTGGSNRSITTTTQQTGVVNNGNITLRASGGYSPYQYSIDGGLTFRTSPIFNKLGPGTYTTVIKDSSGNTITNTVVLTKAAKPTIYSVSLNTVSSSPRSSTTSITKQYVSSLNITPSLPDGVVLIFDLIHNSNFRSSTTTTAATFTTNTLLNKNLTNYSANTTTSSTASTTNTIAGCQRGFVYSTATTQTWTSVRYTNSDTLNLNSSTTITKNINSTCYVGESIDDFLITNLTISGCTNCGVVNNSV